MVPIPATFGCRSDWFAGVCVWNHWLAYRPDPPGVWERERDSYTHALTTAHTRLVPTTRRDIYAHTKRIRKNHLINYESAMKLRHNYGCWYVIKLWGIIICLEIFGPVGLRFCVAGRSGVYQPPFSWPLAAARERDTPGFSSDIFSQISAVNFGEFSPHSD